MIQAREAERGQVHVRATSDGLAIDGRHVEMLPGIAYPPGVF